MFTVWLVESLDNLLEKIGLVECQANRETHIFQRWIQGNKELGLNIVHRLSDTYSFYQVEILAIRDAVKRLTAKNSYWASYPDRYANSVK